MAEDLKSIIARLKASNQTAQQQAVPQQVPQPAPQAIMQPQMAQQQVQQPAPISDDEIFDDNEEYDENGDIPMQPQISPPKPQKREIRASYPQSVPQQVPQQVSQPAPHEVPQQLSQEQRFLMEVEMLQNNGRFRMELIRELTEINKALVVIAGVLVDLTGNGRQK